MAARAVRVGIPAPGARGDTPATATSAAAGRGSGAYLERVRAGWTRLTAREAHEAQRRGAAVIIDTRTSQQRARTANIPGALVIDRTVLEWRLDPSNPWRIPEATRWQTQYVVVCRHGYSSSVAAKALQDVGLVNATDVIGGYDAWVAAGLPTSTGPADVRE